MTDYPDYTEFRYLFPPRPEHKIKPESIGEYEQAGFVAEAKFNGSCAVLFINGAYRSIRLYNRHGDPLTNTKDLDFTPLYDSRGWMNMGWTVLCGEYMNKNKCDERGDPFNHKFIVWDILVWRSKYLINSTLQERYQLIGDMYGYDAEAWEERADKMLYKLSDDIYIAHVFTRNLSNLYRQIIKTDMIEGLVLKRPTAKLDASYNEQNNSSWQVKVRKPTKNYTI